MTKPAITKRLTKGSLLTYEELDQNFQNLDDATITLKAGTGGTDVVSDLNGTITLVAGTNISISGNNTAKTVTISTSGTDIVNDTTPQLGGDLDVNNHKINTGITNGNIVVEANGTGQIQLKTGGGVYVGTGSSNTNIVASGNYNISMTGGGIGASVTAEGGTLGSGNPGITLQTYSSLGIIAANGALTVSDKLTVSNSTNDHSFFYKVRQSSINTSFGTAISLNNLNVRIFNTSGSLGRLELSAVSGSFSAYVTTVGNIAGQALAGDTTSSSLSITAGTWTDCNFRHNLGSGGDVIEAHVVDHTNGYIFRVTAIHGNNTTGGFICIERLL